MYREAYQRGLLTIFFSCGAKPLKIWDTYTQDGYINKFLDEDIKSTVLEIGGSNVSTTYMICPKGKTVLGITMPFLVMVVKNLKKYFSFEVTILDDTGTRRRFRVSNFQSSTQILPLCTVMPIALSEGWNQIQFNLADFTRRAYQKQFVEVQKFKINANIRIRRIYFADRILAESELPAEYKLFIPIKHKASSAKDRVQEEPPPPEKETKSTSASKLPKTSAQAIAAKSKEAVKSASKTGVPAEGAPEQADTTEEAPAGEETAAADQAEPKAAEEGAVQEEAPDVEAGEAPAAPDEEIPAAVEEAPAAAEEAPAAAEEVPAAATEEAPAPPAEEAPTEPQEAPTEQPQTEEAAADADAAPVKESSVEVATQTQHVTIVPEPEAGEDTTTPAQDVEEAATVEVAE